LGSFGTQDWKNIGVEKIQEYNRIAFVKQRIVKQKKIIGIDVWMVHRKSTRMKNMSLEWMFWILQNYCTKGKFPVFFSYGTILCSKGCYNNKFYRTDDPMFFL
jgi:hypothetical protein